MAIQPIDLQILFSQLNNVAKTQAGIKAGEEAQQTALGVENQRKEEIKLKAVNETQDAGEGAETVKEKKGGSGDHAGGKRKNNEETDNNDDEKQEIIKDPALGKNIDMSG